MWFVKTEFTFKQVYGHIDQVAKCCSKLGSYAGIVDIGNTFGHIRWKQACDKVGIKPIFGVQLPVVENLELRVRRYEHNYMTFIAKNTDGLQELYSLVDLAHEQFYYRQRLSYEQINQMSHNIAILGGLAPRLDLLEREIYLELSPNTPLCMRSSNSIHPSIASIDNFYPAPEDKIVYEPFADARLRQSKTSQLHILTRDEWLMEFPDREHALDNLQLLAENCNAELPHAPMVEYIGKDDITEWCIKGAEEKGINLLEHGSEYGERFAHEMGLIKEKGYVDYFLVVADVIRYAKTKMVVGPSRGSSAGSLVCYLMGITEIDPLEYDLYFERFIDVNRHDLPDIDVDFQDEKRGLVIKYLQKKYGKDCVAQIGNISRMKPKSAIQRFAQALVVPIDDVQELKDAIMDRSGGDARANLCISDTLTETEVGKKFMEQYPRMGVVAQIESHASHTGVHAAGILVCNSPITNYAGVNSRDNKRIAMLDKRDAEHINLLKIDALGLRTLSILASVCDQIGKPYTWLYKIPINDDATYHLLNQHRFHGIFQFEGPAIKGLAKQMPIDNMEDIAALSALGRPGPLASGGANSYIKFRSGKEKVKYVNDHPVVVEATAGTYGVIVYQEQVMKIVRELGNLSWEKTSAIRKAMSKTLGVEFFDKMYAEFEIGALENDLSKEEATEIWEHINTMGSWSFNKSHAVSYGLVSYLCAYMKANHFMEFAVASLNHARDDATALKLLRDMHENDGIEYVPFDEDLSEKEWSVYDGVLYGGLLTIHGIGPVAANKVLKSRKEDTALPAGIRKKLTECNTPFKYLYPAEEIYGDYYSDPESHGLSNCVSKITNVNDNGKWTIIGCMIKKNLRDANEACFVAKRDGKYVDGPTSWLNITLEDDTDSLMCKIKKEDYEKFGREIAESGKENKDWYMVYGKKINGWSILFVTNIRRITRDI